MKNKDLTSLRREMKKQKNAGICALLDCIFVGTTSDEALKQWNAFPPALPTTTKECRSSK